MLCLLNVIIGHRILKSTHCSQNCTQNPILLFCVCVCVRLFPPENGYFQRVFKNLNKKPEDIITLSF